PGSVLLKMFTPHSTFPARVFEDFYKTSLKHNFSCGADMVLSATVPMKENTMIRPASEIEYPPSEAMCTKARMIARMETLSESSDSIVSMLATRFGSIDEAQIAEIESFTYEQKRLLDNMKRLLRG
ncbi:MAG: hypothetical protein AAF412_12170, partial [Pseudomonadota bacterium]